MNILNNITDDTSDMFYSDDNNNVSSIQATGFQDHQFSYVNSSSSSPSSEALHSHYDNVNSTKQTTMLKGKSIVLICFGVLLLAFIIIETIVCVVAGRDRRRRGSNRGTYDVGR